jgi:hypothetical protein
MSDLNISADLTGMVPVGTEFKLRKGKSTRDATVIGYRIEHNSDTGVTSVSYRVGYDFCGQRMTDDYPRNTITRALWEERKATA